MISCFVANDYLYKKEIMLVNLSHDYASKKARIDAEIGHTFSLEQRKNLDGISFKNLPITAASIDIYNLIVVNDEENRCTIEMRPKGILISFRSLKETYGLAIPYYKLRIYKGKAEEYSFYRDQHFIKVWAGREDKPLHDFVRKIKKIKLDNAPTQVEDLL